MTLTFHDCEQRSATWYELRRGRLTSTGAADMLATHKDGKTFAASRVNLLVRLVLEHTTTYLADSGNGYQSRAMQDGLERQDDAATRYELITDRLVYPVGFVSAAEYPVGVSPDGLVGDDGSVSIKCPIPATHLAYLRTGVIPKNYLDQIRHELWVTGRAWVDYFSYSPEFAELKMDAKLTRVYRKDLDMAAYEKAALAFLAEVEREIAAVRTMADTAAVLRQAVTA